MGEDLWFFNGFKKPSVDANGNIRHSTSNSKYGVYQQRHREEIAEALGAAFKFVAELLGYFPRPVFVENEIIHLKKRAWWDQEITLPRRKLIRFAKPSYEERPGSVGNIKLELSANNKIPGYRVQIQVPSGKSVRDIKSSIFFTLLQDTNIRFTGDYEESLFLTQIEPYIEFIGGTNYYYRVRIPAWELANQDDLFENLSQNSEETLEYTHNWGSGQSIVSFSSIDILDRTFDAEDSVQLLSRPTNLSSSNEVIKTSVKPIITDYEKGKFWLKHQDTYDLNAYPPYAINISYESGLDYQEDGEMDPVLEMAIITLANTMIQTREIPVSNHADTRYYNHRTSILTEKGRLKGPSFANPLGDMQGHSAAWKSILPRADRVKGQAWNLRY